MAMAPFAPRPTFKRPDLSIAPHCRPSSPIAPTFEPLSPARPIEPTFNYPAFGAQQDARNASAPDRIDDKDDAPPNATKRSSRSRKHERTPSTIDDLADAALSKPPSAYAQPQSQPPPQAQAQARKPSSTSHQQSHYSPPQYPMPVAHYSPNAHGEPAAKRARSEVGLSPHAYPGSGRPSTSHVPPNALGWAYNVEQNFDRARRQSSNTSTSIPSEDAELLLNFASRVHPRPAKVPSPVHESTAPLPSALAPSVLSPPTLQAHPVPQPQAAPPAEPLQGTQEDPSTSLPSPQNTNINEEERAFDSQKAAHRTPAEREIQHAPTPSTSHQSQEQSSTLAPQQTRTPPEEELAALANNAAAPLDQMQHDTSEPRQASQVESLSAADTAGDTDSPKPRPRRGWPKGKPRGPRNKGNSTKPRSAARRSRASAKANTENSSTTSGDDMSLPLSRRKSETDLTTLVASSIRESDLRHSSVPPNIRYEILSSRPKTLAGRRASKKVTVAEDTICSGCSQTRESMHGELDQWIGCNGCKGWFHYDCAGFKNERDVRDVDKFFCKPCESKHGATTFVRKSTRTHTNVDYAGLNQGILKTSDEDPEHHYIQPIKDGTLTFDPETFPRMRPELVTAEYFQTSASFNEPILIPAAWNPKRDADLRPDAAADTDTDTDLRDVDAPSVNGTFQSAEEEDILTKEMEYETSFDDGQDKLGMIVPQGLTVRHVANIVGPDEPLEVIDVKTQGTEGKWNLARFADYYESEGEKPVRNVISLEVSHTKLGRLLQRPKVVRQIDLQDSVWPADEAAKGNYPKVQFYCLMSVEDSFTDFHIDFGGSSVYYHILRGRKTFFFIPPKPSHLKAYEDWNNSPEQNFTWLPSKTKECYRVDLYEGDTMLIPSGWIHAVWTPTNSLVIGGNFLTRLHYSTQFRIVDIEKANKTPLKFRYPQFQKVMWYTVIKYLETDQLPGEVAQSFYQGAQFYRERPIWQDFFEDASESDQMLGMPYYNARYYSQAELDGLPELINFIFRTVMISLGRIEGVSEDTRKKVVRSIPKSHGDPLDIAKAFALWVAWKRGNEDPPAWAHPDADLPDKEAAEPKKLSARALKQLQRQEAINAYRLAPDRQSARQQASREAVSVVDESPAPSTQWQQGELPMSLAQYTSTPKTSVLGPKRVACDACRKRRIRCKHKEQVTQTTPAPMSVLPVADHSFDGMYQSQPLQQPPGSHQFIEYMEENTAPVKMELAQPTGVAPMAPMAPMTSAMVVDSIGPALVPGNALLADPNSKRGRSKACLDCRKSKRRCVHDENGRVDPVKAEQTPVPRGSAKRRKASVSVESPTVKKSRLSFSAQSDFASAGQTAPTMPHPMGNGFQQSMPPAQQYQQRPPYPEQSMQQPWQQSNYMYPDPMDADTVAVNNGPYHQQQDTHMPYSQSSLEQLANDVLDSRYVNNDEDGGYTVPQHNTQTGAVQPISYPLQPVPMLSQPHHSSDSAVSMPDGQHLIGGPVQAFKPTPEATSKAQTNHPLVDDTLSHSQGTTQPSWASGQPHQEPVTRHVADAVSSPPKNGVPKANVPENIQSGTSGTQSEPNAGSATLSDGPMVFQTPTVDPAVRSTPAAIGTSPSAIKAGLNNFPLYEPPPSLFNRRSSKASQPTERPLQFETPQQNGRRRSLSKTPVAMEHPEPLKTPGSAKKPKQHDNSVVFDTKRVGISAVEHNTEKSAAELQNDESLRLAKELQDQEWGLRRRSKEAL